MHLRYDAGCRAMHLCGLCSEGCVVLMLRRYRLVMAELSFLRLFFGLKPTLKIQKPGPIDSILI